MKHPQSFKAAEHQAQRAGRLLAKTLSHKRAADHHRGVKHALEQHDQQAGAALEALSARFTGQTEAAKVRLRGLEQQRTHLTDHPLEEERHPWFPPGVEHSLWRVQGLLLVVLVLGELVLTKAGLDLLRWSVYETLLAALSLLVAVTALAHLGGGLLRDKRTVLAVIALGTALLLHLAFAGLRTMHLMSSHKSLSPMLLFGLLLTLGFSLTVATALLGSLKPSKQALLENLEVRLARLRESLEQRTLRFERGLEEQRRLWAARQQAFWTGFQQVQSAFSLPFAYHQMQLLPTGPALESPVVDPTGTPESDDSQAA